MRSSLGRARAKRAAAEKPVAKRGLDPEARAAGQATDTELSSLLFNFSVSLRKVRHGRPEKRRTRTRVLERSVLIQDSLVSVSARESRI